MVYSFIDRLFGIRISSTVDPEPIIQGVCFGVFDKAAIPLPMYDVAPATLDYI
jgi:hypothetical protein